MAGLSLELEIPHAVASLSVHAALLGSPGRY